MSKQETSWIAHATSSKLAVSATASCCYQPSTMALHDCWTVALLFVLLAQSVPSQEPPSKSRTSDQSTAISADVVRPLLRDLDGDTLELRDATEQRLVQLGAGVLRFLPEIKPSTSGEMKIRLQRIRDQLQKAEITTFFESSTITLNGKLKLADAIAKISAQTGNAIELRNAEAVSDTEIEISADRAKFWDVMHSVLKLAKLTIDPYTPSESLTLIPDQYADNERSRVTAVSGPFMFHVLSTQSELNLLSPVGSQMRTSILVTWEPRLKPVFLKLPMQKVSATLPDGTELAAMNPQAAPEFTINPGMCSIQLDLQLAKPPRSATKLAKLKGEVEIAVPGDRHQFTFEKFTDGKPQSIKRGDVNVVLEGAHRNNQLYEFRLRADFSDTVGILESFRNWIMTNKAYLLDEKGNQLEAFSSNSYATKQNSAGAGFLFQINGDPSKHKLVYEFPVAISRQTVPFELSDIELP